MCYLEKEGFGILLEGDRWQLTERELFHGLVRGSEKEIWVRLDVEPGVHAFQPLGP